MHDKSWHKLHPKLATCSLRHCQLQKKNPYKLPDTQCVLYSESLIIKYHLKEIGHCYRKDTKGLGYAVLSKHQPVWPLSMQIALIGVIQTHTHKKQKVIFSPSFGLNKVDLWLTAVESHERKASLRKYFLVLSPFITDENVYLLTHYNTINIFSQCNVM